MDLSRGDESSDVQRECRQFYLVEGHSYARESTRNNCASPRSDNIRINTSKSKAELDVLNRNDRVCPVMLGRSLILLAQPTKFFTQSLVFLLCRFYLKPACQTQPVAHVRLKTTYFATKDAFRISTRSNDKQC